MRKDRLPTRSESKEAHFHLLDRSSTTDESALEYTPRGSLGRINDGDGEKLSRTGREERREEARAAIRSNLAADSEDDREE